MYSNVVLDNKVAEKYSVPVEQDTDSSLSMAGNLNNRSNNSINLDTHEELSYSAQLAEPHPFAVEMPSDCANERVTPPLPIDFGSDDSTDSTLANSPQEQPNAFVSHEETVNIPSNGINLTESMNTDLEPPAFALPYYKLTSYPNDDWVQEIAQHWPTQIPVELAGMQKEVVSLIRDIYKKNMIISLSDDVNSGQVVKRIATCAQITEFCSSIGSSHLAYSVPIELHNKLGCMIYVVPKTDIWMNDFCNYKSLDQSEFVEASKDCLCLEHIINHLVMLIGTNPSKSVFSANYEGCLGGKGTAEGKATSLFGLGTPGKKGICDYGPYDPLSGIPSAVIMNSSSMEMSVFETTEWQNILCQSFMCVVHSFIVNIKLYSTLKCEHSSSLISTSLDYDNTNRQYTDTSTVSTRVSELSNTEKISIQNAAILTSYLARSAVLLTSLGINEKCSSFPVNRSFIFSETMDIPNFASVIYNHRHTIVGESSVVQRILQTNISFKNIDQINDNLPQHQILSTCPQSEFEKVSHLEIPSCVNTSAGYIGTTFVNKIEAYLQMSRIEQLTSSVYQSSKKAVGWSAFAGIRLTGPYTSAMHFVRDNTERIVCGPVSSSDRNQDTNSTDDNDLENDNSSEENSSDASEPLYCADYTKGVKRDESHGKKNKVAIQEIIFRSEIKLANNKDFRCRTLKFISEDSVHEFFEYLRSCDVPKSKHQKDHFLVQNTGSYKMISDGINVSSFSLTTFLQQRHNILSYLVYESLNADPIGQRLIRDVKEFANFAVNIKKMTEIIIKSLGEVRTSMLIRACIVVAGETEYVPSVHLQCKGCSGLKALFDYSFGVSGKMNTSAPSREVASMYSFKEKHEIKSITMNHTTFGKSPNSTFTIRCKSDHTALKLLLFDEFGFLTPSGEDMLLNAGAHIWNEGYGWFANDTVSIINKISQETFDRIPLGRLETMFLSKSLSGTIETYPKINENLIAICRKNIVKFVQAARPEPTEEETELEVDPCFLEFFNPQFWTVQLEAPDDVKKSIIEHFKEVSSSQRVCLSDQTAPISRLWIESVSEYGPYITYNVANNRISNAATSWDQGSDRNKVKDSRVKINCSGTVVNYCTGKQEPTMCSPLWSCELDQTNSESIKVIATCRQFRICKVPVSREPKTWIYMPCNTVRHLMFVGTKREIEEFNCMYLTNNFASSMRGIVVRSYDKELSMPSTNSVVLGILSGTVVTTPQDIAVESLVSDCLVAQYHKPLISESENIKVRGSVVDSEAGKSISFEIPQITSNAWFISKLKNVQLCITDEGGLCFSNSKMKTIMNHKKVIGSNLTQIEKQVMRSILSVLCFSYSKIEEDYIVNTNDVFSCGLVLTNLSNIKSLVRLLLEVQNGNVMTIRKQMMEPETMNSTIFGIRSVMDCGSTQIDYTWRERNSNTDNEVRSLQNIAEDQGPTQVPLTALSSFMKNTSLTLPSGIKSHITTGKLGTGEEGLCSNYNGMMFFLNHTFKTAMYTFKKEHPGPIIAATLIFGRGNPFEVGCKFLPGEHAQIIANSIVSYFEAAGNPENPECLKFHKIFWFFINNDALSNIFMTESMSSSGTGWNSGFSGENSIVTSIQGCEGSSVLCQPKMDWVQHYEAALVTSHDIHNELGSVKFTPTPLDTIPEEPNRRTIQNSIDSIGASLRATFGKENCILLGVLWQILRCKYRHHISRVSVYNAIVGMYQDSDNKSFENALTLCFLCAECTHINEQTESVQTIANTVNVTLYLRDETSKGVQASVSTVNVPTCEMSLLQDAKVFPCHNLLNFEVQPNDVLRLRVNARTIGDLNNRLDKLLNSAYTLRCSDLGFEGSKLKKVIGAFNCIWGEVKIIRSTNPFVNREYFVANRETKDTYYTKPHRLISCGLLYSTALMRKVAPAVTRSDESEALSMCAIPEDISSVNTVGLEAPPGVDNDIYGY